MRKVRPIPNQAVHRARLEAAGLRPTAQRIALASVLFDGPPRHATASELHREAADGGHRVSLATVYNTLAQFVAAGLLREVHLEADHTWYDTNVEPHCHIFDVETGALHDAPLPPVPLPEGLSADAVVGIDVIFRVQRGGSQ